MIINIEDVRRGLSGLAALRAQARDALVAHYTREGLTGETLNGTVERVMAVQFKPIHARELGGFLEKVKVLNGEASVLINAGRLDEADVKIREAENLLKEFAE